MRIMRNHGDSAHHPSIIRHALYPVGLQRSAGAYSSRTEVKGREYAHITDSHAHTRGNLEPPIDLDVCF